MMNWISVETELPIVEPNTDGIPCAVLTKSGNVYRARWMHDIDHDVNVKYWSGFDVREDGVESEWYEICEPIKYWIPLPY